MRLLVFQHTAGEPPAAFGAHANAAGDSVDVVRLFEGDPIPNGQAHDALMVMGGPMDVWDSGAYPWLTPETAAIRAWVGTGKPYLGICLGHQLLIEAMGGACRRMASPEIAVSDVTLTNQTNDPVLGGLPHSFPAMHWHGVEAATLPNGATPLGHSAGCAVQAMRLGTAWGLQFHPELQPGTVTQWMQDAANLRAATDWLGSEAAAWRFVDDAEAQADQCVTLSAQIYAAFRQMA